MKYDNKKDLVNLRYQLNYSLSLADKTELYLQAVENKLMTLPLVVKLSFKFVSLFRKNASKLLSQTISERNPEIAKEMWDSMIDHMVNGKDMTDSRSAGGWNEEELNTFCSLANKMLAFEVLK